MEEYRSSATRKYSSSGANASSFLCVEKLIPVDAWNQILQIEKVRGTVSKQNTNGSETAVMDVIDIYVYH
jgi:hypothetical protein